VIATDFVQQIEAQRASCVIERRRATEARLSSRSLSIEKPWHWSRSAIETEPMREIGAWWVSRFERVPSGFEVVLRRGG